MKRKYFLGIVIFLLLLGSFFIDTYEPIKKEIPLPEKEENAVTFTEALPNEAVKTEEKKEAVTSPVPEVPAEEEKEATVSEVLPVTTEKEEDVPLSALSPFLSIEKNNESEAVPKPEEELLPEPSPPHQEESAKSEITEPFCTLTVRCDDVLKNIEKLATEKHEIIPANGFIFPKEKLTFTEGESVFDLLLRTMKERRIHMDFVDTPMYNSVYIKGIGNLYEFDCGDTSGWIYTVNGESPLHGCSQHKVKQGDVIEFKYICSLY